MLSEYKKLSSGRKWEWTQVRKQGNSRVVGVYFSPLKLGVQFSRSVVRIRFFSSESVLHIRWTKYWSFSFSISPSNEYSGLISFRMDWLDLLAVQGALKTLLQNQSCQKWKERERRNLYGFSWGFGAKKKKKDTTRRNISRIKGF